MYAYCTVEKLSFFVNLARHVMYRQTFLSSCLSRLGGGGGRERGTSMYNYCAMEEKEEWLNESIRSLYIL